MASDPVRCWLVNRTFDDRGLIRLTYATPDGDRYRTFERSAQSLRRGSPVTAAREIEPDNLEAVIDEETRDRYATEAQRLASTTAPDDPI